MKYLILFIMITVNLWAGYSQKLTTALDIYDNPKTRIEGTRLIKIEADKGDATAQYVLAEVRAYNSNYSDAIYYYKLSLDQGLTASGVQLGLIYFMGKGVPVDKIKGFKYTWRAAKAGNKAAQNNIKLMCKENPSLDAYAY